MTSRKITVKFNEYKALHAYLSSGDDDECRGCTFNLAFSKWYITIPLPQIIKPFREWQDTSKYEWGGPNGGYWSTHPRQYGAYLFENHLYFKLGPQTNDSLTTKSWSCFLPWGEWRFVRFSLYGLNGEHFWTQAGDGRGARNWDEQSAQEKLVPKHVFQFLDYDGERIEATTHIEEREWKRGEKWCKWLSLFYAPKVRRSLDIEFSKEVGDRKGSWKGGIMGTGIDLLPGELHEAGFRRYCHKNGLTMVEMEVAA